jgi:hypothetical protein
MQEQAATPPTPPAPPHAAGEADFDLFKMAEYAAQTEAHGEEVPAESAAQLQALGLSPAAIAARLEKSVTEMELFLAKK